MYILIYNSESDFPVKLDESFIQINTHDKFLIVDGDNYLYKSNKEEFYLNSISESLDEKKYSDVKAIIIDKNLGGTGWTRSLNLAGHIACAIYLKCELDKIPIILTDWNDLNYEDSSLKETLISDFFQTDGFYFRKYEELFSIKTDNISKVNINSIDKELKKLRPINKEKIRIESPSDNSHQATNEWGAMRLASNFGIYDLINFKYPKHLYFKYLSKFIKNNKASQDNSLFGLFNRILLIDDNADCGWSELLRKVHNCTVDKMVSVAEVLAWKNITPEKFDNYDLIYLDLYLKKGKADSGIAINLLNFIKGRFPHIPVIIFTASNKAWNLNEVLEKGADAMYIKESPIYFKDDDYSQKNYHVFSKTILELHAKYKILKPYWNLIRKITSHPNFNAIENAPRKLKDRIEERLKMFYGLLKKGYEQRDYDKQTFFYSDYELAFMTLWSIFNEVQEVFYLKKQISICHSNGVTYYNHPDPNRTLLSRNNIWELKGSGKIFINNSIQFDGSEGDGTPALINRFRYKIKDDKELSDLKYDPRNSPHYSIDSSNSFTPNPFVSRALHSQIAYIILNRTSHTNQHLTRLYSLSEKRNAMYLTHGDSFNNGFFNDSEEDKRSNSTVTPQGDIKDLFDLIAYLITDDITYKLVF